MRPKSRLPWDLHLPVSGGLSVDGSQGRGHPAWWRLKAVDSVNTGQRLEGCS